MKFKVMFTHNVSEFHTVIVDAESDKQAEEMVLKDPYEYMDQPDEVEPISTDIVDVEEYIEEDPEVTIESFSQYDILNEGIKYHTSMLQLDGTFKIKKIITELSYIKDNGIKIGNIGIEDLFLDKELDKLIEQLEKWHKAGFSSVKGEGSIWKPKI
jgi:hypothetical protein